MTWPAAQNTMLIRCLRSRSVVARAATGLPDCPLIPLTRFAQSQSQGRVDLMSRRHCLNQETCCRIVRTLLGRRFLKLLCRRSKEANEEREDDGNSSVSNRGVQSRRRTLFDSKHIKSVKTVRLENSAFRTGPRADLRGFVQTRRIIKFHDSDASKAVRAVLIQPVTH